MLKKIIVPLIVCILSFSSLFLLSSTASASSPVFKGRSGAKCGNFLGLTSWDCGVNISNENSLKSGIWKIAVNILNDIVIVAAYLIIGYVIYGGYLYTMSGGDPSKVANGKKTLIQAFIGLAIVMSANIVMSTIRFALLRNDAALNCDPTSGAGCVDNPGLIFTNAIQWTIGVVGVVSAIFVVYGGVSYIMSSGDPSKVQKAKQTILYALIGLIIVALAEIITSFVSNMIKNANNAAAKTSNQIIISKEVHEIQNN